MLENLDLKEGSKEISAAVFSSANIEMLSFKCILHLLSI